MKRAVALLACTIGATTLLGGMQVLAKTPSHIEFVVTEPMVPMYKSIYESCDSIYMTIMDMSLDYTMEEYNEELVYGVITFLNNDVGNIKSIRFNKYFNKLEVVDEYFTKMVVRFNEEQTNIDKVSISGKSNEYMRLYINDLEQYGSCGTEVISIQRFGKDVVKAELKDTYGNKLLYILWEDEFYFEITSDENYTQSKVIYSLMTQGK